MPVRKPFYATTVALEGSNLIEASAGTGKTYSIALLVLRLVLEKKLSVKEILMVTFTKAAVAELEERIRLFVRNAYKASKGEKITDAAIMAIVANFPDQIEARRLLKEAVLFLDETSVLTIHSFCQKTLNEFAFETNQLFGSETIKDTNAVIEDEINKFWRKNITTIQVPLLKQLMKGGLSKGGLKAAIKESLAGKRFFSFDMALRYSLEPDCQAEFLKDLEELEEAGEKLNEELIEYFISNKEQIRTKCSENRFAKKMLLSLIESPEEFVDYVLDKRASGYIVDLFGDILEKLDICGAADEQKSKKIAEVLDHITCFAIQETFRGIAVYKQLNNQMSFDDMIVKLHEALMKDDGDRLKEELQNKYKAVFVDEFQDTDRLQYEIFKKAFSNDTTLFYIGDPKQSIYAFRKADIFTYFEACNDVQNMYDMKQNFRSSVSMIHAMNAFFLPHDEFETFSFSDEEDSIKYVNVTPPENPSKGCLHEGGEEIVPITICELPNKDSIVEAVAADVIQLLENPEITLPGKDGKQRRISPSDIGILVKTGKEGQAIKSALSRYAIPAVTISDDKILQSKEARFVLYLLEAMMDISGEKVNKALLSPFTKFTAREILQLNSEKIVELFRKYKSAWEEHGIFNALTDFAADFNVQKQLLENRAENGERIITNLFQLIELLHKVQTGKKLSPAELVSWLKRGIEGMEVDGDEYLLRIENDEEAVKIVTIHSSKGLEYNIVIAPHLDFVIKTPKSNEDPVTTFRDGHTGEYVALKWSSMNAEQKAWYAKQSEQENRRLLYVAITRSIYKCSIYRNGSNYSKGSTLEMFINNMNAPEDLINKKPAYGVPADYTYSGTATWREPARMQKVSFHLSQENWAKMSYTLLSAKNDPVHKGYSGQHDIQYDDFIFRLLTKGAQTGNMLHTILENIHFGNAANWPDVIDAAINRFAPGKKELYGPNLLEMMECIMNARMQAGEASFKIADIAHAQRIHEFEFDFPVSLFSVAKLETLSDENMQIRVKTMGELEGIMNGKIDMFFMLNGKYYILDWKSNYLGDSLECYNEEWLSEAMNENNYHLQYLVYTLAVKKYLGSRIENFDYETDFGGVIYVFLRGARKNSDSGIFMASPSIEKIEALEEMMEKKRQEFVA